MMIVGKGQRLLSLLRLRDVRRAAAILGALFVVIQFVRPDLTNPPVVADLAAPPEVQRVLRHSCYNCHSNETQVPWFDRIVPVYWKVVEDVRHGREHLNFSSFGRLPPAQQKGLLYESVNQIRLGAMPPSAYTLVHPGSVVAPGDLALLERYLHPEAEEQEVAPALPVPATPMFPSRGDVPPAPDGLALVRGYEDWQAVAATDRFDNGTVRVILANDVAIRALKDGRISPWPDGATFAKVAWNVAVDATGVVRAGSFRQVELMVKDAAKYASTEGWGWGRWLGAELRPYGDSPLFTGECTSCHAPMHRNDYVFTMPIRSASARADLLNTAALPSDDFTEHPLEWRVVTLFVDKRAATLSIVYGNALAVEHARDGSRGPYPPGAALARVTWSEREDPNWFGARIAGRASDHGRRDGGRTADLRLPGAQRRSSTARAERALRSRPCRFVAERSDLRHGVGEVDLLRTARSCTRRGPRVASRLLTPCVGHEPLASKVLRQTTSRGPMPDFDERTKLLYRPVNDVGGLPREPLNLAEHAILPWEKRCHALLETLNARGVVSQEEKRRGIEDMGQTIYAALTYYEKWAMCAANVLMTKGHFTADELAEQIRLVRQRFEEGT